MPFVSRDSTGNITAVFDQARPEAGEELAPDRAELVEFLLARDEASPEMLRQVLAETDLATVRLVEDLIDILLDKHVIRITDLPAAARDKYLHRRLARDHLHAYANFMVPEKDIL